MPVPLTSDIVGTREKFLLYGDPGMGKTFCALTAPAPIYFLSIGAHNEAKTYFSKHFQKKYGKREILIDVAEESIDTHGQFGDPVGFDRACTLLDEALALKESGEIEFETIVIDNATVLEEYQMNKVIAISDASRSAEKSAKTASTLDKFRASGIMTPADHDWMGAQSLMDKFVSWLFRLDVNIVFVAHQKEITVSNRATQTRDVVGVKPLFVGQQRDLIANKFDNVWHFTKKGQMYIARTTPVDKPYEIIAKTRVGGIIDDDFIDPDLSDAIQELQDYAHSI